MHIIAIIITQKPTPVIIIYHHFCAFYCRLGEENISSQPDAKIANCSSWNNANKKLSYRLQNMASASCFRLDITLLTEIWLFEFSYTLLVVGAVANIHGNGCIRVYKNSIHSSLTRSV